MAIKIAIIGKSIRNKKFDSLWEILETAVADGQIEYDAYSLETYKDPIDKNIYNGIVYIATAPSYNDPAIYLPLQATPDQINDALSDLANKIRKQSNKEKDPVKTISVLTEIDNKQIKLTENDIQQLARMKEVMEQYGYSIIQTIVE
jgi:hypothetical protein